MENKQVNIFTGVFYEIREIDFLLIFSIIAIAVLLMILTQRILPWIAEHIPGRFRLYILPLAPVLRLIIIIGAVVGIIPLIIKPTFQNFVAVFGSIGLAAGFAFKDYMSSLIAGVVAICEHPYRQGDWVRIDGAYGEIKSMGLRALRIATPDDTVVTIPHAKIWNTNIYNANFGKRDHLCVVDFYLHPEHDSVSVRQKLMDVALTSPYLQINRPVSVIVSEKPWGTHYRIKAYPIDNWDEFEFVSDLTMRGKTAIAEMGVKPVLAPVAVQEERA